MNNLQELLKEFDDLKSKASSVYVNASELQSFCKNKLVDEGQVIFYKELLLLFRRFPELPLHFYVKSDLFDERSYTVNNSDLGFKVKYLYKFLRSVLAYYSKFNEEDKAMLKSLAKHVLGT